MVFIVEVPIGLCGGYASAAFLRWGTVRSARIVRMSPTSRIGIICIASRCGRFMAAFTERADFVVRNRPNDTHDTKASSRDTPTIHGITTMTFAGVFNVADVAEIPAVTEVRARRSGPH